MSSFTSTIPGVTSSPAPITTTVPAEEAVVDPAEKVLEETPYEVRPGVFFDPATARAYGYEEPPEDGIFNTFKRLITGQIKTPPAQAFITSDDAISMPSPFDDVTQKVTTEQMGALRTDLSEKLDVARYERLKPQADQFGVDIVPGYESPAISNLINEKSELLDMDGQNLLYLADTPEQYLNVMEQLFGEGNVRMITDEGINNSLFAPKYYVSVKQDDDTYTDFAPATVGAADFIERYLPGVGAETAAYLPGIPLAIKAGAIAASASGPFAVVTGPVVFGYTLFSYAKGVEGGRQFLQDYYELNDKQADAWENYIDVMRGVTDTTKEIVFPEWLQDIMDDREQGAKDFFTPEGDLRDFTALLFTPSDNEKGSTPEESFQQFAGYVNSAFGAIPAFKATFNSAISRLYESGAAKVVSNKIESAVKTQSNVVRTMGEGAKKLADPLFLGTDNALKYLTIPQIYKSKVVGRLTSLVSQSSLKIDEALRAQMQSAAKYIDAFKDKFGGGNFQSYLNAVEGIGRTLRSYKDMAPPEMAATDRSLLEIGENIGTLEDVFLAMRGMASEGQYNNIFSELKNATYDLNAIRELVPSNIRKIIPVTEAASKPKTPVAAGQVAPTKGEMPFETLLDELMVLGTTKDDGSRLLSPQGVRAAVKKFEKDHPEFNFDPEDITSPAELLHLYAKRFGDLAVNTFGEGAPAYNKGRFKQAMAMRGALLKLIGNPKGVSDDTANAIRERLNAANKYSSETFDLTQTASQTAARIARKGDETPESGQVARNILYPQQEVTRTAQNIAEQSRQVKAFLADDNNVTEFTQYLIKKNSSVDLGVDAPKANKAFDDVQDYFKNRLDDALYRMSTVDTSIQEAPKFLDNVLAEFKDPALRRALGLTDEAEQTLRQDATMLARFQTSPILLQAREMVASGSNFKELFQNIDWSNKKDIRKSLQDLQLPIRRTIESEAKEQLKKDLRKGLIDYIFSTESGVLTQSTKSGVLEDFGDIIVDGDKLSKLINDLDETGAFKDILLDTDKGAMSMLAEYASIVKAQIADAGSALSGAQVIGNMFTLDPRKFAGGIARLSSQNRIASLLVSPKMVDVMLGKGKPMTQAEKIKNMFFGKTAIGNIVFLEAMGDRDEMDINAQTDAALSASPPVQPFTSSIPGVQP